MSDGSPGSRVFWTLGDGPTQEVRRLTYYELELALKAQVLLTDEILASASFFYESPLTAALLSGPGRGLVRDRELRLFVGRDVEGFEHHALEKARKSPTEMREYARPTRLIRLSRQLDRLTEPLFRRPVDISGAIVELWRDQINNDGEGSLGGIANIIDQTSDGPTSQLFREVADARSGDFVWPFVVPILKNADFSPSHLPEVRSILNRLYATASAAAVDAIVDIANPDPNDEPVTSSLITDPYFLIREFRAIGVLNEFSRLSIDQVRDLKRSSGWLAFSLLREELIRGAARLDWRDGTALAILRHAQRHGTTRQEFSRALASVLFRTLPERGLDGCADLSERLLTLTDVFGDNPVVMLERSLREEGAAMNVTRGVESPLVFVVHGRDHSLRLELKNYIQNTLRWREPVILAERPSHGRTIIEKFEASADSADYAFVLLSADDVAADGESRARQNVIFELGYFVGIFGRTSGRVLLLRKGDVRLPGDLDGVIYVDVTNGIESAGEIIRRELGLASGA